MLFSPSGKLRRDKFQAIVHTRSCRIASPGGYAVKHTNDTGCRQVGVHFHGQYFTAEIVKHVERAKTLTVHQRIAHKVHRPATVDDGLRLQTDGSSAGQAPFSFAAHVQLQLPINSVDALMVPCISLATQHSKIFGKSVSRVALASSRSVVITRLPSRGVGL